MSLYVGSTVCRCHLRWNNYKCSQRATLEVGTPKQNYSINFLSDDSNRSIVYCKITRIDKSNFQILLEESWSGNINLIHLASWNSLCSILLIFRIELVVFPLQSPLHTIFVHIHNFTWSCLRKNIFVCMFSFLSIISLSGQETWETSPIIGWPDDGRSVSGNVSWETSPIIGMARWWEKCLSKLSLRYTHHTIVWLIYLFN